MTLREMIQNSKRIVFFGGAGVSTESGIPDFRSKDGLYRQHYAYDPEVILSADFFRSNQEEFFRFYRDKMLPLSAKPNAAHRKLAEMEEKGILSSVVTQNIDGLHQAAGSKKVFELHGSIHRNYCMKCGKFYPAKYIAESKGVPKCECGGTIKPDVVLYGEPLNDSVVRGAIDEIKRADMLIIAGTSLSVYPAAGFINYFRGNYTVLINRDETPLDESCDLCLHEKVGEVFEGLMF